MSSLAELPGPPNKGYCLPTLPFTGPMISLLADSPLPDLFDAHSKNKWHLPVFIFLPTCI